MVEKTACNHHEAMTEAGRVSNLYLAVSEDVGEVGKCQIFTNVAAAAAEQGFDVERHQQAAA